MISRCCAPPVAEPGSLTASYRALPTDDPGARTCLAGWDPDVTVWLTGTPAPAQRIGTETGGGRDLNDSMPWMQRGR